MNGKQWWHQETRSPVAGGGLLHGNKASSMCRLVTRGDQLAFVNLSFIICEMEMKLTSFRVL